jgi:class 3 adenylate cyclase
VQPLAEVDLLLTEELRSFHATDIRLGGITFHGMRVHPLVGAPAGYDAYLVKVNYQLGLDPEAPTPTWTEVGLRFTTPGVVVSDALPRAVSVETPPVRYAVTQDLDFIRYEPDLSGRVLHDHVPLPSLTPVVDCLDVGGPGVRWRRTGGVRPGSDVGWLIVATPAGCQELVGDAIADYALELADTWGLHPRGRGDCFTIRLPPAAVPDTAVPDTAAITVRLGFTVDVVGYGKRSIRERRQIQTRLRTVFCDLTAGAGFTLAGDYFQGTGDGVVAFFPPDVDLPKALDLLLTALPRALAADNRAHDDPMRLRMAVDIGTVGLGPLGFVADAVINFCRLVDSEPIRDAIAHNQDAPIAVLVSDTVHHMAIRPFDEFAEIDFQRVDVVVKNYQAQAHLTIEKGSPD